MQINFVFCCIPSPTFSLKLKMKAVLKNSTIETVRLQLIKVGVLVTESVQESRLLVQSSLARRVSEELVMGKTSPSKTIKLTRPFKGCFTPV
ncbi:MAG: hypothetical protein R3D26_04395 [Cyanobacteriota/Melainabacteria group bacterium]